jgi:hypothetical protein
MLEPLFEKIHQLRSDEFQKRLKPYPRSNPIASDISKCARETALGVLHWQDRPAFSESLIARMEVGTQQENLAAAKLLTYGVRIVEQQQRFEHRDKAGRLILRGQIDGKVEHEGKRIPFDYKTVNPMIFPRMNTVEDFLGHPFFSKYPKQLWTYELMNNIELGFLWLDNLMGEWKFIEVPFDYDGMEQVLKQCEAAVDAIEMVGAGIPETEALPPYHKDPSVCLKCWARGRVCNPPFFGSEGMQLIQDPELEQKLKRRAELDPMAVEYDRLDKDLKEVLKEAMKPEQVFIIGNWMVKAEEKKRSYKAQPAKPASTTTYLGFEIEEIKEKETEDVPS